VETGPRVAALIGSPGGTLTSYTGCASEPHLWGSATPVTVLRCRFPKGPTQTTQFLAADDGGAGRSQCGNSRSGTDCGSQVAGALVASCTFRTSDNRAPHTAAFARALERDSYSIEGCWPCAGLDQCYFLPRSDAMHGCPDTGTRAEPSSKAHYSQPTSTGVTLVCELWGLRRVVI
jgi:hypothetical protein